MSLSLTMAPQAFGPLRINGHDVAFIAWSGENSPGELDWFLDSVRLLIERGAATVIVTDPNLYADMEDMARADKKAT